MCALYLITGLLIRTTVFNINVIRVDSTLNGYLTNEISMLEAGDPSIFLMFRERNMTILIGTTGLINVDGLFYNAEDCTEN